MPRLFLCYMLAATFSIALSQTAMSQTVQLPTVRNFGVQTSVSVPDGGTAHLGGVSTSRSGSFSRGVPIVGGFPGIGRPFNNRAMGSSTTSNQAFVQAQIIDLRAMDEAILAQARAGQVNSPEALEAQFLSQHVGRNQGPRRRPTRLEPPLPVASSNPETQRLLDLGDRALSAGDYELATRYYAEAELRSQRR